MNTFNPYPPGRFRWNPLGGLGETFWAELSIGAITSIIAAAVKAAYLLTLIIASFLVIFSPLTGMFVLLSKM